ncbi:MAG: hypothetical protein ACK50A_01190 [Sphingobacteriaceae bacterium]|jgi:hypothetical protein
MSWELFNQIYERKREEFVAFDTTLCEDKVDPKSYHSLFSKAFESSYNKFVDRNREAIDATNNNFVIDFKSCETSADNSGYAVFWVQPIKPTHYYSRISAKEILIEGIMFEVRWFLGKQIVNSFENPVFQYEICGWFHPNEWGGRNKLNYSPIGKTTFAGFDRIICEKHELTDRGITRAMNQDFDCHFYKCLSYYFI